MLLVISSCVAGAVRTASSGLQLKYFKMAGSKAPVTVIFGALLLTVLFCGRLAQARRASILSSVSQSLLSISFYDCYEPLAKLLRYMGVIWLVFLVLRLLLIRFTHVLEF